MGSGNQVFVGNIEQPKPIKLLTNTSELSPIWLLNMTTIVQLAVLLVQWSELALLWLNTLLKVWFSPWDYYWQEYILLLLGTVGDLD